MSWETESEQAEGGTVTATTDYRFHNVGQLCLGPSLETVRE